MVGFVGHPPKGQKVLNIIAEEKEDPETREYIIVPF